MWKFSNPIKHPIPLARWPTAAEAARSHLFQPITIGPVTLESRTWVPAMVPWRATEDGFVTEANLDWYRRFARGLPGAIVVEATGVRDIPSGPLLRIGHDRFIPGLKRLVETVREASDGRTRLFIQIIDFLAEEPSEYGLSCVGSRGITGILDNKMLDLSGPGGEKLRDALRRVGGDPAAVASPTPPMGKSIGEIFDQQAHLGHPWILRRAGGFAQSRVTQLNDGSDGHRQFSIVCYRRLALVRFYLVVTGGSDPIGYLSCDGGVEQVEEFQLFFGRQE